MKIGVAGDPFNRLAQLQTGSPHPLRMAWSTQVWGDAYQVEAEAHAMLDRHRIGGEWFAVPADVAVAAVSGAAYRFEAIQSQPNRRQLPSWLKVTVAAFAASGALMALNRFGGRGVAILLSLPICVTMVAWILTRPRGRRLTSVFLCAVGFAVAGLCAALADEDHPAIPVIDSAAYCAKTAALLGDNPVLRNGCLTNENGAEQSVRRVWSETPQKVRTDCLKLSAFAAPSYQGIAGCLSVSVGTLWLKGELKITR